jgi:hypothetical protein
VLLDGSLEGSQRNWVRSKARGDGMPLDWGRWSRTVIEDLTIT